MFNLFSILVSFYVTVIIIPVLRRLAANKKLLDIPDDRKIHKIPVPRIGGIGIVMGSMVPVILWVPMTNEFKAFLIGTAILFVFGVVDDLINLGYKEKILGQILAIGIIIVIGDVYITNLGIWIKGELLLPSWLSIPLTFFFILGITNAINLADGLDGLAGGICIFIFSTLALLAYLDERSSIVICCLGIAGALLAFLRFNTFPASIFMGDAGSQFLGFSAAVMCLYLTQSQSTAIAPVLPLIILGFPILDTLTVMSERIATGGSPFKPDLRHFHYRLLKLGFSPKEAVLGIYFFQSLIVLFSIQLRYYTELWIVLTYFSLVLPLVLLFCIAYWKKWKLPKGAGIENLWNKFITKNMALCLEKLSLNYIRIILPLGLIWLAVSSPIKLLGGGMAIFFMVLAASATFWINRSVFNILFRLTSYVLAMYLLITSQVETIFTLPFTQQTFHYLFWGSIGFSALTFLTITRFKLLEASGLDYLVILLVISLSFLPLERVGIWHLGRVAGGMVVFLWASDILITTQKSDLNPFSISCLTAALILFSKYLVF